MHDSGTRQVNAVELLGEVPKLEALEAAFESEPFAGSRVDLHADCRWTSVATRRVRLEEVRSVDLKASSRFGALTLKKAFLDSTSMPSGESSGVCSQVLLVPPGAESTEARVLRRHVFLGGPAFSHTFFPLSFEDTQTGSWSRSRIATVVGGVEVEALWFKEESRLVLEAKGGEQAKLQDVAGATQLILSYLTGNWLFADRCDVWLSSANKVLAYEWHGGRAGRSTSYTPVPCNLSGLSAASEALSLPKNQNPLDATGLGKCVEGFLAHPDLVAPIENLLTFHAFPVEMRGVFLSVALEGITHLIEKDGALAKVKPIDDAAVWKKLRTTLIAAVEEPSLGLTADQVKILTERIKNANSPTNRQKLTAPFLALDIPLSADEEAAISKRNTLLHSGRLLSAARLQQDPEAWVEAYEVEMKILTAVNKLLLKYLGYSGPVIDWGAASRSEGPKHYVLIK